MNGRDHYYYPLEEEICFKIQEHIEAKLLGIFLNT